jgi:23S rRNA pseudouridine955/2504/2580 synthase
VRVRLGAGRHHQVRAHLAAAGFPIVGDDRYGGQVDEHAPGDIDEHAHERGEVLHLHAASVRFRHPVSGETILIEAPPPDWAMIRA